MVKPDGVARGLIHDIIARWEKRGFTLVGIKILRPDRKLAEAHYADLSSRPFCARRPPVLPPLPRRRGAAVSPPARDGGAGCGVRIRSLLTTPLPPTAPRQSLTSSTT